MSGRLRASCIAAFVLITSALACRQLVGIHDEPSEDVPSSACGLPYAGACATCVSAHCCDQAQACAGRSACGAYATCLDRCHGDVVCRSACERDPSTADTEPEGSRLRACLTTSCAADCTVPCGGYLDMAAPPDAAAACLGCWQTSCEGPNECGRSVDCTLANRCQNTCRTGDCFEACDSHVDAAFADASTPEGGFGQSTLQCAPICGSGQDWSCVGHVVWPYAAFPQTDLIVHGDPSLVVDLCASPGCAPPSASGSLADGGVFVFHVPLTQFALGPGLAAFLHARVPNDDGGTSSAAPSTTYWGFPLSQDKYDVGIATASRAVIDEALSAVGEIGTLPGHGHVYVTANDCRFAFARDVELVVVEGADDHTHVYYFDEGGVPVRGVTKTSTSGTIAVANVPAGVAVVELR
ncbi:MAG TPA: hypothetical protein VIF62_31045, partial [Labilithrix sp.]